MIEGPLAFGEMRPRLMLLLELYRNADTVEARATVQSLCEDVFLSSAWHIAVDLLDNGWVPTVKTLKARAETHLRVVKH